MRIIKFRAKTFGDSVWIQGGLRIRNDGGNFIETTDGLHCFPVLPETIGQFTGLKDMSGNEIYEGDLMGLPERDSKGVAYKNRFVRVVEWVNDGFFLLDYCTMGDGEVRKYGDRIALEISLNSSYAGLARCFKERGLDYTVIGNVHDNPELLKGGKR